MNNVGLTISEGVANGTGSYGDVSKRNIGLLGMFNRGAGFSPTKITSLEEFNTIFGGANAEFYGPAIVKSIFDEADGAPVTLYIARVIGADAAVATATTNVGEVTMTAKAAYRGKDDPGAWANGAVKVELYNKGKIVKGFYTLKVAYDSKEETYSYATLKEIQNAVNRVGKFVSITFSGEPQGGDFDINKLQFSSGQSVSLTSGSTSITCNSSNDDMWDFSGDIGKYLVINSTSTGKVVVGKISGSKTLESTSKVTCSNASYAVVDSIGAEINDSYTLTLTGGSDGEITEEDFKPVEDIASPKGLACFDGFDVQILACTEYHSISMARVLNEYVKKVGNPIGVVNLPYDADETTAELYNDEFSTTGTSFLAVYMGWVTVLANDGSQLTIPAIGAILGAGYIRTPYLQGDYIHIPPAGTDSVFKNVVDVHPQRLSQASINKLVQQLSCNVIRWVKGIGYYVGTSRTTSVNQLYMSVHIRLQTSYYLRVFDTKLRFMEQKGNTPELKNDALVELRSYFQTEYDNGALERSIEFSEAYKGVCDKSNNPSTQDRKLINIDLYWVPTECTESIHVTLQRNDGILKTIVEE